MSHYTPVNIAGGRIDTSNHQVSTYSLSHLDLRYLNEVGDSVRGNINMKNNRILNLGKAIINNDAVNKIYVDNKISDVTHNFATKEELTKLKAAVYVKDEN